jgi:hypothetical protein
MSQAKVEVSKTAEYRIVAPNGDEGLVYDFGDRAHVLSDGECFEAFINTRGEFNGLVYRTAEPGSLDILEEMPAEIVKDKEFIFEDEPEDGAQTARVQ